MTKQEQYMMFIKGYSDLVYKSESEYVESMMEMARNLVGISIEQNYFVELELQAIEMFERQINATGIMPDEIQKQGHMFEVGFLSALLICKVFDTV